MFDGGGRFMVIDGNPLLFCKRLGFEIQISCDLGSVKNENENEEKQTT
jgi:hypothetical protein